MTASDGPARGSPSWLRTLLLALLAVGFFAAAIARLRRIARPRFEAVARIADGRVIVGRAVISRPDAPALVLGWSVACGGREVIARLGERPLQVVSWSDEEVRVRDPGGIGRSVRVAVVRLESCAVEWQ